MKNVSCVLLILVATCASVYAQTGPTGTWRVEGIGFPFPWEAVLRADGSSVTGKVSSCASVLAAFEIFDGKIEGNTITFKCRSGDGLRTVSFTGTLHGDEIAFAWELRAVSGDRDRNDRMFDSTAPPRFIAKRVRDGEPPKAANGQEHDLEFTGAVNLIQEDIKSQATLLIPQKVGRVRAVLVVITYGLGYQLVGLPEWSTLAKTLDAALLGVNFDSISRLEASGLNVTRDTARADAFVALLQRVAQDSGHQELTDAPLLFWGHSLAGSAADALANGFPQRTLAFVRYHSGHLLNGDLSVLSKIPALFLVGGKDPNGGDAAETLWKSGRALAAPWTFAVQPDATHGDPQDLVKANDLLIPWIEAVLRQRLSADAKAPRPITDASAWLGNNKTGEVAPYGPFPGSKVEASWLPDEASARAWRAVLGLAK